MKVLISYIKNLFKKDKQYKQCKECGFYLPEHQQVLLCLYCFNRLVTERFNNEQINKTII